MGGQTGAVGTAVRVGAVALVLAVLVVGLAWAFQRELIYLPSGAPDRVPDGTTAVALRTDDGLDLTAWYAPPTARPTGATVLVLPGNAGNRAARAPLARAITATGSAVLLLEYRGYGGNPGSPTEDGLAADARAAHAHLVDERGVDPARLVLFGESLGGAVATRLALELPVGGLVLRSPFTSLADMAAVHYPFLPGALLLRDRFPVRDTIAGVEAPVVVVAGPDDATVPFTQSADVAEAAGAELVAVPGAGHNDAALGHGPDVIAAVVRLTTR